jgi:hypothetical protein
MKNLICLFLIFITTISLGQTQIFDLPINEIRGSDTTQGGCSDYVGKYVTTTGVIYGPNFGVSINGLQYSLIDRLSDTLLSNKSGINLFKNNQNIPITLNQFDSVRVWGQVGCFFGASQITIDSVKLLKQGCDPINPKVVLDLNETTEANLVKLLNVEFIPSSWPTSPGQSGFVSRVFIGVSGTSGYKEFDVRIDNDCDLYGQTAPQGKLDIIGLGGQFDGSVPRNSGYQIYPRGLSDISPAAPVELPIISFQDTLYSIDEGTVFVLPVISSSPVSNQISCLVISENITTTTNDFSLQQPNLVTFPTNSTSSNFGVTLNTDQESESDEIFLIKLRKISNDYNIGQDSICKIRIIGTLSVKNLKNFELYKDFNSGNYGVKLPFDFSGRMVVLNHLGQKLIDSNFSEIENNLSKLSLYPNGIYRISFISENIRITKTINN